MYRKSSFFLSGRALTPPPLSGRATKKKPFFVASLKGEKKIDIRKPDFQLLHGIFFFSIMPTVSRNVKFKIKETVRSYHTVRVSLRYLMHVISLPNSSLS